ncbi:MAG: hypothetical protein ABIJ47_05625 [Candidatus Bathyarchaeota archaeon]
MTHCQHSIQPLTKVVQNILSRGSEESRRRVREATQGAMERLLETTDARVRGTALRIILSLLEGDMYTYLRDRYIQAFKKGSDQVTDLREALLSNHPEKRRAPGNPTGALQGPRGSQRGSR